MAEDIEFRQKVEETWKRLAPLVSNSPKVRIIESMAEGLLTGFIKAVTDHGIVAARTAHQSPEAIVKADPETEPHIVKVGVYVLNVGKLDTSTGAFTVDFYLSFSSDNESSPGAFEFANGRATSAGDRFEKPGS
jgi:hypothetical protein